MISTRWHVAMLVACMSKVQTSNETEQKKWCTSSQAHPVNNDFCWEKGSCFRHTQKEV
jgi:hypothetical protein